MSNHTFVIPAYKDSPYLEECIHSLLEQTVESSVIITTSTPSFYIQQLARRYNLKYYINPDRSRGIANDWNFALSKAETALVTIAHQDDIYEPDYAKAIFNKFQSYNPEKVLIAFTDYRDITGDKIKSSGVNAVVKHALLFPFLFCRKIGCGYLKQFILRFGDPICCPSVTFNKVALADFKFNENYRVALDWYAWYQLAKRKGSFLYINKKLVRHRIHSQSETTQQIIKGVRKQEEQQIFELMWGKAMARLISRIYAFGHKENLQ
jgi:cellulose synthase/poly-beta-1,6-N-acetylglucosamine synthase-like glycosyltransferase